MTKEEIQKAFLVWTKYACPTWKDRLNEDPHWKGDMERFFAAGQPEDYVDGAFDFSDAPEGVWYWMVREDMWSSTLRALQEIKSPED